MTNFRQMKQDNKDMIDMLAIVQDNLSAMAEQLRQKNQQIDVLCGIEPEVVKLEDHSKAKKS